MHDSSDEPELTLGATHADGPLRLIAKGGWTAEQATRIEGQIPQVLDRLETGRGVRLDLEGVTACDTYGALLVDRLVSEARARGHDVDVANLSGRFHSLDATVRDALEKVAAHELEHRRGHSLGAGIASAGRAIVALGADLVALANLFGAVVQAIGDIVRGAARFRLTATVYQFDRVAWQAIPIILLITFLIGAIIAQQGFFHFRKFGADQYVVDMIGILMLREIGVLLVAIMIAGRSGSSYTAELGSMKMREEIDALRTMGLDPVAILILPRLIALILALPALAFLGSLSALFGGGLVAWVYGDMNPHVFIARLQDAISLTHFKVGIIKAPFMALVIGLVACVEGLRVKGSAESLGLQTTASVVKSIFMVIVLDGLFAIFFASIGM
jgi:phospholipid/cholesterol/gamma-HCH transport system permease protein